MEPLWKDDIEEDGAKLDNEELRLLVRLTGILPLDFLREIGFTDDEAMKIIRWHYSI